MVVILMIMLNKKIDFNILYSTCCNVIIMRI
jgi:hypothetical protein